MTDEVLGEIMQAVQLREAKWFIDNNKAAEEITKFILKLNFLIKLKDSLAQQEIRQNEKIASLTEAIENMKNELDCWMQQLTQ